MISYKREHIADFVIHMVASHSGKETSRSLWVKLIKCYQFNYLSTGT